jgi:osmoprotectant transport system permease protein
MALASFLSDLASAWERKEDFWPQTGIFLSLVLRGLGLALLIGIPTGVLLNRVARLSAPVIAVLGLLQTIPSLVLLALLVPWLHTGEPPALFATVVYSLFPIVMNTHVGLTQVPLPVKDAARGMGMTGRQILLKVELPLAFPVVLAGVRTAAIYAIGVVTICTYIGAGGLGDYISTGLSLQDNGLIWLGALPILGLTLVLFWSLGRLAQIARWDSALGLALGGAVIITLSGYAAYPLVRPLWQSGQPERAIVRIGTKDFVEGKILTEIMKQMLQAHTDLDVQTNSNLGVSVILVALQNGAIDLYPEYTGNLLTSKEALNQSIPAGRSTITDLVRREMRERFRLVLLDTFGLNNTYAPCLRQEVASKYGLRKISDLRRVPQLRVVYDLSFPDRPDGWRGLVAKYNLRFDSPPRQLAPDLIYTALEGNAADLVIGFATDWQIRAFHLVVLEDDRNYFPSYHGAPLVRADTLARHPEIATVLNRLHNRIDDDAMRRMNYQVAKEKRSEEEVARTFLQESGLLAK